MGLTHSTRRNRLKTYRFLARNLITPISEIVLLKEAFCGLPGTKLSKLKNLHSENSGSQGKIDGVFKFCGAIRPNGGGIGTTV